MTPLANDNEHYRAAHKRWSERNHTPRYQAIIRESREWFARKEELVASGMSPEQAVKCADAEWAAQGRERDHIEDQCGGCAFYVCLEGLFGMDWGACSNPASSWDGTLKFEHDGCEAFVPDEEGEG